MKTMKMSIVLKLLTGVVTTSITATGIAVPVMIGSNQNKEAVSVIVDEDIQAAETVVDTKMIGDESNIVEKAAAVFAVEAENPVIYVDSQPAEVFSVENADFTVRYDDVTEIKGTEYEAVEAKDTDYEDTTPIGVRTCECGFTLDIYKAGGLAALEQRVWDEHVRHHAMHNESANYTDKYLDGTEYKNTESKEEESKDTESEDNDTVDKTGTSKNEDSKKEDSEKDKPKNDESNEEDTDVEEGLSGTVVIGKRVCECKYTLDIYKYGGLAPIENSAWIIHAFHHEFNGETVNYVDEYFDGRRVENGNYGNSKVEDTESKDIENENAENKDVENKDVENKEAENKDVENKDVENKDVENKDAENKDIENDESDEADETDESDKTDKSGKTDKTDKSGAEDGKDTEDVEDSDEAENAEDSENAEETRKPIGLRVCWCGHVMDIYTYGLSAEEKATWAEHAVEHARKGEATNYADHAY